MQLDRFASRATDAASPIRFEEDTRSKIRGDSALFLTLHWASIILPSRLSMLNLAERLPPRNATLRRETATPVRNQPLPTPTSLTPVPPLLPSISQGRSSYRRFGDESKWCRKGHFEGQSVFRVPEFAVCLAAH